MKELEKLAIDKWPESFKSAETDFTSGDVDFLEYTVEKPLERIRSLRDVLREEFVQRNEAIDCCLASLISGVPALLIGPPGVAKSMVIRQIKNHLGENAKNFEYLLTKFTTPEELFGAAKLEELKQGAGIVSGESAKSIIDNLLYAKLPSKLKRSVNMARLEKGS